MNFYETHYQEYINKYRECNFHPELTNTINNIPHNLSDMCNQIIYGPIGCGKYTQCLAILEKFSPSRLKYDKKITVQTDKQKYVYHISDIHYEIDMSLLGCNSKIIWHEIFLQIVDIVSVCNSKQGIIVCKNFHLIHTELLDIFYSYLQQYNHPHVSIKIKFIIITDNISFIPNNILTSCNIISVGRPRKEDVILGINHTQNTTTILDTININHITNLKEVYSFDKTESIDKLPVDIFNVICDNIIADMVNHTKKSTANFRDTIYDILVYNLDVHECIWYILSHFIYTGELSNSDITDMIAKTFIFFKNYNNNYRPIYHLESILFYFISKIYKYEL
jgi:hypothetical protein